MKKGLIITGILLVSFILVGYAHSADDSFRGVRRETKALLVGVDEDGSGEKRWIKATVDGYAITSNLPSENSYVNETTATSQELCAAGCHLLRLIVGVADAGTTVELYDEGDATCDANKIITIDSSAVASIALGLKTANGLCMKTVGHDTGNVTVVYK